MDTPISQLEQRVRQRARASLNHRIHLAVSDVRDRFAGMNTEPALIALPRMKITAQTEIDAEACPIVSLRLTTKAAAEIFMAALLAERSEEEEQRALDEVVRLAEAAAGVLHG